MTTIFEHTDEDGDRIEITAPDGGDPALLTATSTDGEEAQVYIAPGAVDRLRAALAPYGTKPEAAKPADIVEGGEYRLLPGARYSLARSAMPDEGTTRVRVVRGPDWEGDYRVQPLDGEYADGGTRYVLPQYLAPLAEAPTTEAAPDPAALLDPLRLAAWEKASEMLRGNHTADARDVLSLSVYLLGESA